MWRLDDKRPMRLKDIQNIFHKELDKIYGKEEVDSFFFMLIDDYFNIFRIELALKPELSITKEEQEPVFKALHELKNQKPIQYILGKTEFFGLPLKVNNHVLIPRPETEELVDWILHSAHQDSKIRILDIGTGSGCIAIALAKNLPKAKVFALEVSQDATEVAKENAIYNNVSVEFVVADILNLKNEIDREMEFDIIVSNPPYVRELEKFEIKTNVIENEPHIALFVQNDDALQFYKVISEFAMDHLTKNGLLFFEINEYLGKEMIHLLKGYNFKHIQLKQDIFKKDRMIKASI